LEHLFSLEAEEARSYSCRAGAVVALAELRLTWAVVEVVQLAAQVAVKASPLVQALGGLVRQVEQPEDQEMLGESRWFLVWSGCSSSSDRQEK